MKELIEATAPLIGGAIAVEVAYARGAYAAVANMIGLLVMVVLAVAVLFLEYFA